MDIKGYMPRLIDKKIEEYLKAFGAVCVEGAKWCGKTWTSEFHSNSAIFLGDPANNFQNRRLAEMAPELVLEGEAPHLVDEWQEAPSLWDAVRFKVNKSRERGLFILTGSATPNHKGILHSGAGRIARIRMRPMSLYESGDSTGNVSLEALFQDGFTPALTGEVELDRLIEYIIRGGWPGSLGLTLEQASLLPEEYLKAVVEDDVFRIDGVKRNTVKMNKLLRSLARNESTTVTNRTIKKDIKEIDDEDINIDTVSDYLDILERLFIIDDQPPFSPEVRSSVRLKQSAKRHFVDPSLAASLLNCTVESLMGDLTTLGFLFEALCERDLRIYAESFGGALYHYQDYRGKEIDAVVQHPDGEWAAFEIKLGANQIDAAAEGLLKLQNDFSNDPKGRPPKFLGVICGMSNAAYRRPDGVYVIPITALRN